MNKKSPLKKKPAPKVSSATSTARRTSKRRSPVLYFVAFIAFAIVATIATYFYFRESEFQKQLVQVDSRLDNRNDESALRAVDSMDEKWGTTAESLFRRSRGLRHLGRYKESRTTLDEAGKLGLSASILDHERELLDAEEGLKHFSQSELEQILVSAEAKISENAEAILKGFIATGNRLGAEQMLRVWPTLDSDIALVFYYAGNLAWSEQSYDEGLKLYLTSLEKNPNLFPAKVEAANAYLTLKNPERAIDLLIEASSDGLNRLRIQVPLTRCYLVRNEFDLATAAIEKFYRSDDFTTDIPKLLAKAKIGQARYPEAINILTPYVAAWPDDVESNSMLATAYQFVGNESKADEHSGIAQRGQSVIEQLPRKIRASIADADNVALNLPVAEDLIRYASREDGLSIVEQVKRTHPDNNEALRIIAYYEDSMARGLEYRNSHANLIAIQPSNLMQSKKDSSVTEIEGQSDAPIEQSRIRFESLDHSEFKRVVIETGYDKKVFGMLESFGGGVGVIDYDLDGLKELCVAGGGDFVDQDHTIGHKGFLISRIGTGSSADFADAAKIDFSPIYNHGIQVGDVNCDGFDDLLITGYGGLQLFINLGDGTFAEATPDVLSQDTSWSVSGGIADFNGDTIPDLFVTRYIDWSLKNNPSCFVNRDQGLRGSCSPSQFTGVDDSVYLSDSQGGYAEKRNDFGVIAAGRGLGTLVADFDGDRDLDVYIANDTERNFLYRNDDNKRFFEVGVRAGVGTDNTGISQGSMGIAIGDTNNDHRFDLLVTNFAKELPALYLNRGKLLFRFESSRAGIGLLGKDYVSWGTALGDFDNDQDEDLVAVSGHVDQNRNFLQTASMLENSGRGTFVDVSEKSGPFFRKQMAARGLATLDFNSDGKIDFVTTNIGQPIEILQNRSLGRGKFLQVTLVGVQSERIAVGTTLELSGHDFSIVRQVVSGGSYCSSSDPMRHFGISEETALPLTLKVSWPSGVDQSFKIDALDQHIMIVENALEPVPFYSP